MITATYDPETLTATATAQTSRGTVAADIRPIYHADNDVVRLILVTHSSFDRTNVVECATRVDGYCHALDGDGCWCNVESDRHHPNLAIGARLALVTDAVLMLLADEHDNETAKVDPIDYLFRVADGIYDAQSDICYPVPASTSFDNWFSHNATPAAVLVDDVMMETNRAVAHVAALVRAGEPVSVWLVPPSQIVRMSDI